MGGSQVLLDVGEVQPFSVLLKSAIVGSANDASVAIAEALYGSENAFVERMNERARELEMCIRDSPEAARKTAGRRMARFIVPVCAQPRSATSASAAASA